MWPQKFSVQNGYIFQHCRFLRFSSMYKWLIFSLCREEATRTPDPHVPNVVRYQLRYFSVFAENLDYFVEIFSLTLFASIICGANSLGIVENLDYFVEIFSLTLFASIIC